jgi:hypothetical protein
MGAAQSFLQVEIKIWDVGNGKSQRGESGRVLRWGQVCAS